MEEASQELTEAIEGQNKYTVTTAWSIDVQKRKLADKNYPKQLGLEAMDLRQQYAMSVININTAKARLEDLSGQINMANIQLRDVLTDKRIVDKENADMELIVIGKG